LLIGTLNNEHRWFNAKDSRLLTGLLSFFGGGKKKIIYNNLKKVRDFYHNMPIVI